MKRWKMKKHIPKNTIYCGNCRYHKYIKTINLHRDTNCEYSKDCSEECGSSFDTSCQINVYRCEFMRYTDVKQESLLWDGCKECGVSYGNGK